ncbi:SDR family oxidoreductase [Streptomyces sp. NPDC005507]|uniref:SDR family oxidoreductase n=1 Tax=Streptomyces sp. NPDC005507 TaxID=3154885 RepID=UPI0033B2CD87
MTISGTRIVLLGGTSGIGLATAIAVAEQGAEVVVVSSRQSSVDAALAQLPETAAGHAVDLTDSGALRGFFDSIGRFDHLVFTAGENLELLSLEEYDVDAARTVFELRLFRALESAHLAVPLLNEGGSIILTSGAAALRPAANLAVVAATGNAVIAAGKALAVELAPIRVNVVVPGVVRSPLWNGMTADQQEAMFAQASTTLPMGRVAEPADVAKAYLALIEQDYVTGTAVVVDGGGVLV